MGWCSRCEQDLPIEAFYTRYNGNRCKDCINAQHREYYRNHKQAYLARTTKYERKQNEAARSNPLLHARLLWEGARHRAKVRNVPFSITLGEVVVPAICPIFGMPLKRNRKKMQDDSATLDRIVPELGYVSGNVIVVSQKANRIKNDATPSEILKVGAFYEGLWTGINSKNN